MTNSTHYQTKPTTQFLYLLNRITPIKTCLMFLCITIATVTVPAFIHLHDTIKVPTGTIAYDAYTAASTVNNVPIVVINGGPGFSHEHMANIKTIGEQYPIIFYDQMGTGKSEPNQPIDWSLKYYVQELENVLNALHLTEFVLLGHSWGAAIALEYANAHKESTYLKGLILSGPLLSTRRWVQDVWKTVNTQLDEDTKATLKKHTDAATFEDPAYKTAIQKFYDQYLMRNTRIKQSLCPTDLLSKHNHAIYLKIQGPSELTINGTITGWSGIKYLRKLTMPVLFTIGQYDEVRPETITKALERTAQGTQAIIPDAGHLSFLDNQEAYTAAIVHFMDTLGKKQIPQVRPTEAVPA